MGQLGEQRPRHESSFGIPAPRTSPNTIEPCIALPSRSCFRVASYVLPWWLLYPKRPAGIESPCGIRSLILTPSEHSPTHTQSATPPSRSVLVTQYPSSQQWLLLRRAGKARSTRWYLVSQPAGLSKCRSCSSDHYSQRAKGSRRPVSCVRGQGRTRTCRCSAAIM